VHEPGEQRAEAVTRADAQRIDNQTLEAPRRIPAQFHSKGMNSVFKGKTPRGKAVHTVVGGSVKYRDGYLVA